MLRVLKANKVKFILLVVIIIIAILWLNGVILKQIGKTIAIDYVNKNYSDYSLEFSEMEYSPSHGLYFAVFYSYNGERYSFLLIGKYLPTNIWFDPLNQPN